MPIFFIWLAHRNTSHVENSLVTGDNIIGNDNDNIKIADIPRFNKIWNIKKMDSFHLRGRMEAFFKLHNVYVKPIHF